MILNKDVRLSKIEQLDAFMGKVIGTGIGVSIVAAVFLLALALGGLALGLVGGIALWLAKFIGGC